MPEINGFKTILPLPPPPHQLTREAQAMMDGYESMTGKIGIEITYLVRDGEAAMYEPLQILADIAGIVFEGMPDAALLQIHIFRGCTNSTVVIDVWQEKAN